MAGRPFCGSKFEILVYSQNFCPFQGVLDSAVVACALVAIIDIRLA